MVHIRRGRERPSSLSDVRVSEHFLLTDFLGCHSVYVHGYRNVWEDHDGGKLREIRCLAENVLEPLVQETPLSISYGYISPDLSRRIVSYQDPNKPSYHRWDNGAAVDLTLHSHEGPPVAWAFRIDANFPMSRTISYSESPYICVATRANEVASGQARKALYENRYTGKSGTKPRFITYNQKPGVRASQIEEAMQWHRANDPNFWLGEGYPTYHGGGRKQLHHFRVGDFCMYSDFLFAEEAVRLGYANALTPTAANVAKMERVGRVYDALLRLLAVNRISIVEAYKSPRWFKGKRVWEEDFSLSLVPPASVHKDDLAEAALRVPGVFSVAASSASSSVRVSGFLHGW